MPAVRISEGGRISPATNYVRSYMCTRAQYAFLKFGYKFEEGPRSLCEFLMKQPAGVAMA